MAYNPIHPWFDPRMLVGARADGYVLERLIGSGGFGAAYLTTTASGERRAVKVVYPPLSRDTKDMDKWIDHAGLFIKEVQIAATFRHPNIIKIYTTGFLNFHFDDSLKHMDGHEDRSSDYQLPFYVMEYIPDDVGGRLLDGRVFTPEEALSIAIQECAGLIALHSANPKIIHRDLNPRNIRLTRDGKAVITDFGVAWTEERAGGTTHIIPPDVAAPEQVNGEEPDERTDIYQVGALLFIMLIGKSPKVAKPKDLLERSNVSKDLVSIILRCLETDREKRFQDARELRDALETADPVPDPVSLWQRFLHVAKKPFRRLTMFKARMPPKLRRRVPWLLGALLGLGILIAWLLPPGPAVTISIASSSTKKEWMNQAIEKFNEGSQERRDLQLDTVPFFRFDNHPIIVEVILEEIDGSPDHYRSGTMIDDTLKASGVDVGKVPIKPTILSPAEEMWIFKLRRKWPGSPEKNPTTGDAPGLLRTPLVIAMWQSRAEALGCWPESKPECTWQRVVALAANPDGWGMYGHPEWGEFKFGYGQVGASNSGTWAMTLICMTGLKQKSLAAEEVRVDNGCGEAIADLHKAKIEVREKSATVVEEMSRRCKEFLDTVPTYEAEVIELIRNEGPRLCEPIVAAYPQDGTLVVTHPFAILDGAPWVTKEQVKAAEVFKEYLLGSEQQALLLVYGLRPSDPAVPLGSPIEPRYGANPSANLVPLRVEDPDVLERIYEVWCAVATRPCADLQR